MADNDTDLMRHGLEPVAVLCAGISAAAAVNRFRARICSLQRLVREHPVAAEAHGYTVEDAIAALGAFLGPVDLDRVRRDAEAAARASLKNVDFT